MQPGGFPVNELAFRLMTGQPQEVYRSPLCENFKSNLSSLEDVNKKLKFELNSGETAVDDVCNDQIRLIQLGKEQLIEDLNKQADALIEEVNKYKQHILCSYASEIVAEKKQANELITRTTHLVQQQRDYLSQVKINDSQIIEANKNVVFMKEKVELERLNVKRAIFGNRLIQFVNSQSQAEDMIGSLVFETVDSSKTVIRNNFIFRNFHFS